MYNNEYKGIPCHKSIRTNEYNNAIKCNRAANSRAAEESIQELGGCGESSASAMGLRGYPLASVYSPLQNFEDIYDLETGLTRGTIFQRLDLPFICDGMSGGVARG